MLTSHLYFSERVFCDEFEGLCHFWITFPGSPCREFTFPKKGGDSITAGITVEGRECCRLVFSKHRGNSVDMVIFEVFTSTKCNPDACSGTDTLEFAEFAS